MRRFSEANEDPLRALVPEVLEGVTRAHGVEVEVDFQGEYPVNDVAGVDFDPSVLPDAATVYAEPAVRRLEELNPVG